MSMMKIEHKEDHDDEVRPFYKLMTCECGAKYDSRYLRGDFECRKCHRLYNAFGQELESFTGNGDEPYWEE